MKLKRLELHDVRNFRGETVIDFTDPRTGAPRDVCVLIGSNGSGKTTVTEVIEGLLRLLDPAGGYAVVLHQAALAALTVELSRADLPEGSDPDRMPREITVAAGEPSLVNASLGRWPECLAQEPQAILSSTSAPRSLQRRIGLMYKGLEPLSGGLLYWPHDRMPAPVNGGSIAPVPAELEWVSHIERTTGWKGSLEETWVWLNYLDLERAQATGQAGDATNLSGATDLLQSVLGADRTIRVREGRVQVLATWAAGADGAAWVGLDQLPSGERQCVTLFGELARRRRRGAVVMIDEPEISLHPAMQRQVVGALRRFGREYDNQIILATHSEEIALSVAPEQVISLDFPGYVFHRMPREEPAS